MGGGGDGLGLGDGDVELGRPTRSGPDTATGVACPVPDHVVFHVVAARTAEAIRISHRRDSATLGPERTGPTRLLMSSLVCDCPC